MQQRDEFIPLEENPYAAPLPSAADSLAARDIADAGEFRPFWTLWTRPRETVRRIVAVNPALHVTLLVSLAGIGQVLDRASLRNMGDNLSMPAILGMALVFGPLTGLFGLWISSHLIRMTGAWIGGSSAREHLKTAIAWASVPAIVALPLWIPQLALFGSDMFTSETPRLDADARLVIPFIAIGLTESILGVWSFVLLCNMIAEVQGYRSAWRALGNLLLAGLVLVGPLVAIAIITGTAVRALN